MHLSPIIRIVRPLLVIALVGVATFMLSWPRTTATWTQVIDHAEFAARDSAEGYRFADKYWLSGGYYHGAKDYHDVWSSTDLQHWTKEADATPYDAYAHISQLGDTLYAVRRSAWKSTDGLHWENILKKTPFTSAEGDMFAFHDKLLFVGMNEIWTSSDGVDWTCETNKPAYGPRHKAFSVTTFKDGLILTGGSRNQPNEPAEKAYPNFTSLNDVWFSRDGVNWELRTAHADWAPRMWPTVHQVKKKLVVFGGFSNLEGKNLGDVWISDDGEHWTHAFNTPGVAPIPPLHFGTPFVHDDHLYVVAGNRWPVVNSVWELTLVNESPWQILKRRWGALRRKF